MKPSVTIIIPTYNRASILSRLLQQVSACDPAPDEIIVVDDHSTDETAATVNAARQKNPSIKYVINSGQYQRDAKQTGLAHAASDYVSFWDDDLLLEDLKFFAKLQPLLNPNRVVQAKVILENMSQVNEMQEYWLDRIATRPYPILEFPPPHYQAGSRPRQIYPLIESCNFWHKSLAPFMIDKNLTGDAYGESYLSSLRLYRRGIKLELHPELTIRHPGASSGGSHRFNKQSMLSGFTSFHQAYFYNMTYAHAVAYPGWFWLWLPYLTGKSLIALTLNRQINSWWKYAVKPMTQALKNRYAKWQPGN